MWGLWVTERFWNDLYIMRIHQSVFSKENMKYDGHYHLFFVSWMIDIYVLKLSLPAVSYTKL